MKIKKLALCLMAILMLCSCATETLPASSETPDEDDSTVSESAQVSEGSSSDESSTDIITPEPAEFSPLILPELAEVLTGRCNFIVLGKVIDTFKTEYIPSVGEHKTDYFKYIAKVEVIKVYEGQQPETKYILIDSGFEKADRPLSNNLVIEKIYLFSTFKKADYMPALIKAQHSIFADKNGLIGGMTMDEVKDSLGEEWENFVTGEYQITSSIENVNEEDVEYKKSYNKLTIAHENGYKMEYTSYYVSFHRGIKLSDYFKEENITVNITRDMHSELMTAQWAGMYEKKEEELIAKRHAELFDEDGALREGYVMVVVIVNATCLKAPEATDGKLGENEHFFAGDIRYKSFPDYVKKICSAANGQYEYIANIPVDEEGNEIDAPEVLASMWSERTADDPKDIFVLAQGQMMQWIEGAIVSEDALNKYGICRTFGHSGKSIDNDGVYVKKIGPTDSIWSLEEIDIGHNEITYYQ